MRSIMGGLALLAGCSANEALASFEADSQSAAPPPGSFSFSCLGTTCVFEASTLLEGNAVTRWEWSWGDGSSVVRLSPIAKKLYLSPGIYAVTLTLSTASGASVSVTRPDTITAEPTGMTRLSENKFNCVTSCANQWYYAAGTPDASVVVHDPSAPTNDSTVVQQNFTPQLPGGSSPATFGFGFPNRRTIYVSFWMKMSSNFVGHPTGVNKSIHFWTKSGRNVAVFVIRGAGSGPLRAGFSVQGLAAPYTFTSGSASITDLGGDLDPNYASCPVERGRWHKYEVVLTNNVVSSTDGRVQYWLDGQKCADYGQLAFVGPGQNDKWEEVQWSPTWGGTGGTITESFFVQMDNLYVSGK